MTAPFDKSSDKSAIRDAATIIVVRDPETSPKILMGQRGRNAAFMPSKFVFPGGAVDVTDAEIDLMTSPPEPCLSRLTEESSRPPEALATAAIRELWEETGQIVGHEAAWDGAPSDWESFAATGHRPSAEHMKFVFRAITPAGRPRRFDARFFMLDAAHLRTDPDDFSQASDELSHIHWVAMEEALSLDLPFITEIVLMELRALVPSLAAPGSVPFFKNNEEENLFIRLGRGTQLSD